MIDGTHTAMQVINDMFSFWKTQSKLRNEKKKGGNKYDASFYDLHFFELVIPQMPTTQHILKFENMKVRGCSVAQLTVRQLRN